MSALIAIGAAAAAELLVARYNHGLGWMTIPALYPLLLGSVLAGVAPPCP